MADSVRQVLFARQMLAFMCPRAKLKSVDSELPRADMLTKKLRGDAFKRHRKHVINVAE